MKKVLSFLFVMFSIVCTAQDKVFFHDGNTFEGKIVKVTDKAVMFIYKGEEAVNTIGINAIEKIAYSSGRVQECTEKIIINSEIDWEKVKVVYDKEEVMGLKSIGMIEKHSNGAWSFHNSTGHFMDKAIKKAKKEAAKRGAAFVLVVNESTEGGRSNKYPDSSIICQLYTYK